MTYADFTAHRPSLLATLVAPFRAIGRGLIYMAENNSRMDAVHKLNAVTDEQLAARGTDRASEVRRIFASMGAI